MIIIIGESGSGKSTVEQILQDRYGYDRVVSHTTRLPRDGEVNGVNYHFVTEDEFSELLGKGLMAEYTTYNGNFYGATIEALRSGGVCIVEKHGLEQILKAMKDEVTVFYLTASENERKHRMLLVRHDDASKVIERIELDKKAFKGVDRLADFVIDTTERDAEYVADFINYVMGCNYFMTHSGTKVYPRFIEMSDFKIEDICHALSKIPRFNGHSDRMVSVLEHSVMVAIELYRRTGDPKVALMGLLHDASEAYIADIPRPFKVLLNDYAKLESSIQDAIYLKFVGDVPAPHELGMVSTVDNWALWYEAIHYTVNNDWAKDKYVDGQITPLPEGFDVVGAFYSLYRFFRCLLNSEGVA